MIEFYLNIYHHSFFCFFVTKITGFIMKLWRGSFFRRLLFDEWGLGFEKTFVFKRLEKYADESVLLGLLARIGEKMCGLAERVIDGSLLLRTAVGFFGVSGCFDNYANFALVFITIVCIPILPTKYVLALCALSIAMFGFRMLLGKASVKFDSSDFFIALFALLIAFSIPISYIPSNSVVMGLVYILFIMFYFVVKNTLDTREKLFAAISALLAVGLFVSAFGILQKVTGRSFIMTESWIDVDMFSESSVRVYSTLENPNVLGEYLIFIIMLAFSGVYYFKNYFYKLASLGILGASGLCLVYTLSRGAWLGLIFAFMLYAIIKDRRLIWFGLIAILFSPLYLPESIIERFLSIGNFDDSSSAYRFNVWLASINMIKDYWPIGIGLGTRVFVYIYQKFAFTAAYALHSHNLFLQLIIDLGISGLFLFLSMIFLFYKNHLTGLKYTKDSFLTAAGAALCAAMGGYMVQGLTDNVWYNYRIVAFFWTMLALAGALAWIMRNTPEHNHLSKGIETYEQV